MKATLFINHCAHMTTVNTYRDPSATVTEYDDVKQAIVNGSTEVLTASLTETQLIEVENLLATMNAAPSNY